MYLAASSPREAGPWLTHGAITQGCPQTGPMQLLTTAPRAPDSPDSSPWDSSFVFLMAPCHSIFSPSYLFKDLPFFPSNIGPFSIILGKPKKDKNPL